MSRSWTGARISRPRWSPSNRRPTRSRASPSRRLAAEVQAGLALMHALDDAQQAAARVQRPNELWAGAGKDGVTPPLEGSAVSGWSEAQQALLLDAVAQWVGLLPAASAEARIAEIGADLGDTHFAWHGDVDASRPFYYRIQGPDAHHRIRHAKQRPAASGRTTTRSIAIPSERIRSGCRRCQLTAANELIRTLTTSDAESRRAESHIQRLQLGLGRRIRHNACPSTSG